MYETRCKQVKIDAAQPHIAQRKEKTKHRSFDRVRTKPTHHPRYIQAEAKYKRASDEANRSRQILRDQVSDFEREKTRDLKNVFGEFLLSEMLFFSKSLEMYTQAYQELMTIDEEEVVEQLDDSMTSPVDSYGIIPDDSMNHCHDEQQEEVNSPKRMAQDWSGLVYVLVLLAWMWTYSPDRNGWERAEWEGEGDFFDQISTISSDSFTSPAKPCHLPYNYGLESMAQFY